MLVAAAIKNAKLSALLILSYHKTENFQINNFSKTSVVTEFEKYFQNMRQGSS